MIRHNSTLFNRVLNQSGLGGFWNLHTKVGLAALDAEINRQAAMVAYIDDFKLIMIIIIVALPMLLLLRRPRPIPEAAVVAFD